MSSELENLTQIDNQNRLACLMVLDHRHKEYTIITDESLHCGMYCGNYFKFQGSVIGIVTKKLEDSTNKPHVCVTNIANSGVICYVNGRKKSDRFNCYVRECISESTILAGFIRGKGSNSGPYMAFKRK